jgi:hypothetical protein
MEMIVATPAAMETLRLARRMTITALKPRCGNNELYKEGNAEAETKRKGLKRAKRARRNAMERERKGESRHKSSRIPRETLKKTLLLLTKAMKARRTLVMEQATGLAAIWHDFIHATALEQLYLFATPRFRSKRAVESRYRTSECSL